jgi:aspartate/methionine/tyrosine aminotransferase
VLLQTAANPSGALVEEADLEQLLEATSPSTIVLLDECHEWLGAPRRLSRARARRNVVRISSLSKQWSAPGLKVGWFLADPVLIADYYEYASSNYGGPPSLLYTCVEVLTRFERWRIEGHGELSVSHLREFEGGYGLTLQALNGAYQSYLRERSVREEALTMLRRAAITGLRRASMRVFPSRSSINLLAVQPGHNDSYRCFREILRNTGVSVYPGVLGFHLAGGYFRITFARKWSELNASLKRLEKHHHGVPVRPGNNGGAARILRS